MNESLIPTANPFDLATLDEEAELVALAKALRLADGFRLLFARCNQPSQRVRLMAKLEAHFPAGVVAEIRLTEPVPHLLDALRERLDARKPQVVFVSGLEYSLPVAAEAENTAFIANLNSARNSFASACACPLVLWLPEYVLTAIVRGAPDFFSIRSGVYFFVASLEETGPLVNTAVSGDSWQNENLSLLEKQERITLIENLLEDYQALVANQRDHWAELQLLERLGHLYLMLGRWDAADQTYQKALVTSRQRGNQSEEANVLNDLGVLYAHRGHWKEAEKAYHQSLQIYRLLTSNKGEAQALGNLGNVYSQQGNWADAEQSQQQALETFKYLGDKLGEGRALTNLGSIYLAQDRLIEAEQTFQQSLFIKNAFGDRHGQGQLLNNLGNVYLNQARLTEAEQAYKQSLQIKRDLGDKQGEGTTLANLGNVYQVQGRLAEAEQVYQQSLQISQNIGDPLGEGVTLGNLALVKEAEGDIKEAIRLGRNATQVLLATENAAALNRTQVWVEEWEGLGEDVSHPTGSASDV